MAQQRQNFVEAHETLLMYDATNNGLEYIGESTTFGRVLQLDHILDEPGDNCVRIVRFNTKTLKGHDVTEAVANSWLGRFGDEQEKAGFEVEPSDERMFPAYVKKSASWADVRDSLKPRRPVYSATREHGTLSHRVQGIA